MKRIIALCLVSLFVLSACQNQKKSVSMKSDAVSALENQLSVNDGKLYVYQDYAIGWNRFVMAHEVGHLILGHLDHKNKITKEENKRIEWEADLFAAMCVYTSRRNAYYETL